MKNFILLTFIFIGLFTKAQQEELIENSWYLQKIIMDENEYITPINEEVSEVPFQFYSSSFTTGVCNGFGGDIQYHVTEQSFTLSDISMTLMDCELNENAEFESLYFWQFFYNGTELAHPFSFSIVDQNTYSILTVTNSTGVQAIYHTQNTVSISKFNQHNSIFSIYPNPASSKLFIRDLKNRKLLSVNMTNLLGQQIMSKMLTNYETEVDISHLDTGVYLIRIYDENKLIVHSEKIIKK